jgi:multidrug efflux system outer membrane protein
MIINGRFAAMISKNRIVALGIQLILSIILAGCTLGPDYQRPEVIVPTAYREAAPWKEAKPADALDKGEWWRVYGDPVLDTLQQQALAANQDLKAVVARVDQARAAARITEADLYPRIDLNPSAQRGRGSADLNGGKASTVTTLRAPFDMGYEVDLWGRVRRSVEVSTAEYEATYAEMQNVLLTLQADVTRNYFNLRSLDAQLDLLRRTVELRSRNLQLVTSLFNNGQVGRLDVATSETELANAQAETAALKRRRAATEHALAVLVGEPVANFVLPLPPPNLEVRPPIIAAGLPSTLLERRPDVAAAERQMIAANARIGIAKAAFFPAVSLTGSAGYASDQLSRLFDWDNRTWSIGPFISLPVFDAGRNRAQMEQTEAAWQESVARYRQQVLNAFREVEDALSDIRILAEQAEAQQRAVVSSQLAADLSEKRYRAGLVSYLEVVVNQRTALATEFLATQVLEQRFQASVSLIKALGGGWQDPGPSM